MKIRLPLLLIVAAISSSFIYQISYSGKPWQGKPQHIPGKIECEFYDLGGEGVAYHDSDSVNNGSGKLNPANGSYLNEFRMKEGVDISYTKSHDIDNNPYSKVFPKMDQLYVGWTMPGEWINYTIKADRTAAYRVGLMYTANGDGIIALDLDGKAIAKNLKITSTHNDQDTVKWRQWHHWNKADSLTTVRINKGIHMLTLHIVANGNMNFDYLEFKK
ncbi:carbohydrate-binding protein [Mucilaginibacter sp. BJC16-A38]|uniref:carbohydrate-binding protein n=1 Tax=Mucilaginibacter phenanthrenivorans TaxID=1234842 RepID=UPI002157D234|nr:carbohydrate-binding protein [Mucilaginibacter phenanthrenivorans]MCR8556839.1 carbohydrate-binding protein [Mucilaginibacter phenanthrenivorans]